MRYGGTVRQLERRWQLLVREDRLQHHLDRLLHPVLDHKLGLFLLLTLLNRWHHRRVDLAPSAGNSGCIHMALTVGR